MFLINTVLYVILAIFIFGLMIFIHELGHFTMARVFGVTVNEFAIGMGPKLLTKESKKSKIRYSLRAFPIGGFVSMAGENEESDDENAFCHKKVWQRMLIIVAGPLMNLLLGFLVMFIMMSVIVASGTPIPSNTVGGFMYNEDGTLQSTSCNYGLQVGDTITKIDGVPVHTGYEVLYEITNSGYKAIDLEVERDGKKVQLNDVVFPIIKDEKTGIVLGSYDFKFKADELNFGNLCKFTFYRSVSTVKMIWDSLIGLISGRFGSDALSGPVGITKEIGQAAQSGFVNLLYLVAVITINLGVFNLLPIPALDGGQLIFLFIELIRRKPVKQSVIGYVNFIGISLMLLIMVIITFKDVIGLFG